MAGRSPYEAQQNFLDPLQLALSCISPAVVLHGRAEPETTLALAMSEDPLVLRLENGERCTLSAQQQYELVETDDPQRGPWKVSTRKYRYRIELPEETELVSLHWHPPTRPDPHLHVQEGRLAGAHIPTGRIGFEAVCRFLLTEIGVRPARGDWSNVLDEVEQAFAEYRTWS